MKNCLRPWAAALLCCALLLLMPGCRQREDGDKPEPPGQGDAQQGDTQELEKLLYVNGQPVSPEELELLDGSLDAAVRNKVLQQWAQELGFAEEFSYPRFLQELEEENRSRAEIKESGGVIYGVVEYSPLQYYNIRMGEYERQIRESILEAASQEELRAWYQENLENFREFGEITAHVVATSGTVTMADYQLELAPDNYRSISEQNEALAAALLELPVGQTAQWTDEMGVEWFVECLSRGEDTYEPFEYVQGAAGQQYASERLSAELDLRVSQANIQDLRDPRGE